MSVLVIDGHPDGGRLIGTLLDRYVAALPGNAEVGRIAVRDLAFDPVLRRGYGAEQPWEPDLVRVAGMLDRADHIVFGFPLWWGAEPALLKGLVDRILLPSFAFKYRRSSPWWDRLLAGRSSDVIVTMDTPPWYLRLVYGDAVMVRWRRQILGFCGVAPVRVHRLGMVRRGGAKAHLVRWTRQLETAARSAASLRRPAKLPLRMNSQAYAEAVDIRQS
ncbi:MAG: NAD(P)H-dependent oxidoreductase [Hyphomicrobiaceae bacterium]